MTTCFFFGVLDRAHAGGVPDHQHVVEQDRAADPVEARGIVLHADFAGRLALRDALLHDRDHRAVARRDVVDIVRGDAAGGARPSSRG